MTIRASRTEAFDLTGRVNVVTGGGGGLAQRHGIAIARADGTAVLVEWRPIADPPQPEAGRIVTLVGDVTSPADVRRALAKERTAFGPPDILVGHAANTRNRRLIGRSVVAPRDPPSIKGLSGLAVGLTGSSLGSQVFGSTMAPDAAIANLASDNRSRRACSDDVFISDRHGRRRRRGTHLWVTIVESPRASPRKQGRPVRRQDPGVGHGNHTLFRLIHVRT